MGNGISGRTKRIGPSDLKQRTFSEVHSATAEKMVQGISEQSPSIAKEHRQAGDQSQKRHADIASAP